jgi:hypothetical protein
MSNGQGFDRRTFLTGGAGGLAGGAMAGFVQWLLEGGSTIRGARPPIIIKGSSLKFLVREDDTPFGVPTGGGPYFYRQPANLKSVSVRRAYSEPEEQFTLIKFTFKNTSELLTLTPIATKGLEIASAWELKRQNNGRRLVLERDLDVKDGIVSYPQGAADKYLDLADIVQMVVYEP